MNKGKIVIGLSGGVDSAVTAYLLKKEGYEVIGATMQIWQPDKEAGLSTIEDARQVANRLGIEHYVLDFQEEFREHVVQYFIEDYFAGRTPNPCVVCNRRVKFESLREKAKALGADYIATGHYAKIEPHPKSGRYTLRASDAKGKDQSYVLYNLTQEQLAHTKMPLGTYNKDWVRQTAKEIGLQVADKPDSMEICFVPEDDYGKFIVKNSNRAIEPGNFVDDQGKILGRHKGIIYYTVGQRKGLGIALGKPVFVSEIRPEKNEIVLADNEALFQRTVYAEKVNFMAYGSIEGELRAEGKIRYHHEKSPCTVTQIDEHTIRCVFDTPQRAITPGQSLVIYEGDYVICGGIITGENKQDATEVFV